MSKPYLTLCMIVKDEEHCIERCLESVAPFIDRYDISDTGSSDSTKEKIKNFFDSKGIPGEIYDEPWQGFGKSRTKAFENCKDKAEYAWVIDADDTLEGDMTEGIEFMKKTKFSSYSLRITRGENFTWWRKIRRVMVEILLPK